MKTKAEEGAKKLRDTMTSEDAEVIKKATEELTQVLQGIGAAAYQQGTPPPDATGDAGPEAGGSTGGQQTPGGEDVVDGEFKSV
jgi:molecular chaperone DnaK